MKVPPNPDVRWHQRLQSFGKAFAQLAKAAKLAHERKLSELEQQGLIQAFEFTQRKDCEGDRRRHSFELHARV